MKLSWTVTHFTAVVWSRQPARPSQAVLPRAPYNHTITPGHLRQPVEHSPSCSTNPVELLKVWPCSHHDWNNSLVVLCLQCMLINTLTVPLNANIYISWLTRPCLAKSLMSQIVTTSQDEWGWAHTFLWPPKAIFPNVFKQWFHLGLSQCILLNYLIDQYIILERMKKLISYQVCPFNKNTWVGLGEKADSLLYKSQTHLLLFCLTRAMGVMGSSDRVERETVIITGCGRGNT